MINSVNGSARPDPTQPFKYEYKTRANANDFGVMQSFGKVFDFAGALAPRLAKPAPIPPEAINLFLNFLGSKLTAVRGETEIAAQEIGNGEREVLIEKQRVQIEEAKVKEAEAKEKVKEEKITGWITAGLAMLGAIAGIAAAVASGGLLIAVAVAGVALAAQEVANMVIKEVGVPYTNGLDEEKNLDISFGGITDMIVDQQVADGDIVVIHQDPNGAYVDKTGNIIADPRLTLNPTFGFKTEEELAQYKSDISLAVNLTVAALMIIASVGGAFRADKALKLLDPLKGAAKTGSKLERAGEVVTIAAEVGQAATAIYQGNTDLVIASLNRDTDRARAYKAFFENLIQDVAKRMGLSQEAMKQLIADFNESFEQMVDNVEGTDAVNVTIAHNMS